MGTHHEGNGDSDRWGATSAPTLAGPAESLAADCIARLGEGETLDVDALAAQLPDDGSRDRLRGILADAQRIQSLMPAQVRPGMLLKGRYKLLREIGAGGMGKVFEALDCQLERHVAVKVLAVLGAESFDPEQLFMQEAVLLASLQHPNIVAVHELASEGDITFLVMDLVQGVSVRDVLKRVVAQMEATGDSVPRRGRLLQEAIALPAPAGRASLIDDDSWFQTAARIVLEVARTIEGAHGKGVIHRDIKPHNVLLRGDGTPVILDFGLAGMLDADAGAVARGLFGTMSYLAPEQAESSRIGADRRTDVYQLGLMLYEFLTLRRAFPGEDAGELLPRIRSGKCSRPRAIDRGIPFELEAICLKAMELDPARRYATATALREDLQRYVEGSELPLAARGGALGAAARSCRYFVRRHKLGAAVAVSLLAGLLAVGIVWLSAPAVDADVTVFRYRTRTDKWEEYPSVATVQRGDVLAVRVDSREPQYVYALSVFGEKDPRTFVSPMPVMVALYPDGRPGPATAPASSTYGLRVDPGTIVKCTQITDASRDGAYEGLWIFTSPNERSDIDDWMKSLDTLAAKSPEKLARYDAAMASFSAPRDVPRGAPVHLSAEQNARMAASLTAAAVSGEAEWPSGDVRRITALFRVEP